MLGTADSFRNIFLLFIKVVLAQGASGLRTVTCVYKLGLDCLVVKAFIRTFFNNDTIHPLKRRLERLPILKKLAKHIFINESKPDIMLPKSPIKIIAIVVKNDILIFYIFYKAGQNIHLIFVMFKCYVPYLSTITIIN